MKKEQIKKRIVLALGMAFKNTKKIEILEKNLEYTEKRLAGLRNLLENIQDIGTTINKSISEKLYQLLDFSQKLISIENNKIKLESEKNY